MGIPIWYKIGFWIWIVFVLSLVADSKKHKLFNLIKIEI